MTLLRTGLICFAFGIWISVLPTEAGGASNPEKRETRARAKAEHELARSQPKIRHAQTKLAKAEAKAARRDAQARAKMQPRIRHAEATLQHAQANAGRARNKGRAQQEAARASANLRSLQEEANSRAARARSSLQPEINQASSRLQNEQNAANARAQRAYAAADGRNQAPTLPSAGSAASSSAGGLNAAGLDSLTAGMLGSAASAPSLGMCRSDPAYQRAVANAQNGWVRAPYDAAAALLQCVLNSRDPRIKRAELQRLLATTRQQAAAFDSNAPVFGAGPSSTSPVNTAPAPHPAQQTAPSSNCSGPCAASAR